MSYEQFAGIIVNKKYYFWKNYLTICKNIHKEDKWFERVVTNVRTPYSSLAISDTILKRFKEFIQQRREIFTVDNQLSLRFLYSDLCLLVRQHWLTFEVIEAFGKIFYRSEGNFTKIYSFLHLLDLTRMESWKMSSLIGKLILDWTTFSVRGSHSIRIVIDITKAKICYYYDSLHSKILLKLNKAI